MKLFNYKIILIVLALFSCEKKNDTLVTEENHEEKNTIDLTEDQIAVAGISLGKIEQKAISGTIKVNGVLDVPPQQLVSISVPLGGFLKSTTLLQGSRVKKGQLIAVIENPEYIQMQQDYLEAKSQFEFADADYKRQQELARENVNAQKTLQQSKSNYETWSARKNGLLAKLKMISINISSLDKGNISSTANVYSPISGYVTQVNVNIGKYVNPTDVLFEIVDTEHLHAELTVFEKDVPKIKIGQKVRFTLANENKDRMATVYLIGREISADRTVRIHCHIDVEDTELLPGMSLKALVETGGALVSALPDESIVDFQGKKFIITPNGEQRPDEQKQKIPGEGKHFNLIEIQTGNSELGYTELLLPEGFDENSEVVTRGAYAILSKLKNSEEEGHDH